MRYTSLLGGVVVLLLGSVRLVVADGPPDLRTVVAPRALAWCGPSTGDGLYPTNELRQGDPVQVVQELESGWLAIRPPRGSFSWINARYVQSLFPKYPTTYVVTYAENPVPVLVGSSQTPNRPNKTGVKLQRGAQVRRMGRIIEDNNKETWMSIDPPESELRYIRKEDVSKSSVVVASAASVRKAPAEPPPPPDGDALWRDAEKAERKGRIADAIHLYRQAGEANSSVNPARADAAYQRAHWLEQAGSNPSDGSHFAPDRRTQAFPVPANQSGSNAFRTIGSAASGPANGQLVARAGAPAWGTQQPGVHRGRLRLASARPDNRYYHLMDARGNPVLSVVAAPGVELSSHVDRNVELVGYTSFDYSAKHHVLVATRVQDMP